LDLLHPYGNGYLAVGEQETLWPAPQFLQRCADFCQGITNGCIDLARQPFRLTERQQLRKLTVSA
jgi:hypothetical protein